LDCRALGRFENLAHVARCDTALAEHLWAAWYRVLRANCSEGRHAVADAWSEEPLGGQIEKLAHVARYNTALAEHR
jgi:hypothetical protein